MESEWEQGQSYLRKKEEEFLIIYLSNYYSIPVADQWEYNVSHKYDLFFLSTTLKDLKETDEINFNIVHLNQYIWNIFILIYNQFNNLWVFLC